MAGIRERFNRLLPCPNEIQIDVHNMYITPSIQLYEMTKRLIESNMAAERTEGFSELDKRLEALVEYTQDTGLAEAKGSLKMYGQFLESVSTDAAIDLTELENPIDQANLKMGQLACARCGGIVVDQRDGKAYCGREVPPEVLQS